MPKPYIKNLWIKRLEHHAPQTIDYSAFYRKYKNHWDNVIYIKNFGRWWDRRSMSRNKSIYSADKTPQTMVEW